MEQELIQNCPKGSFHGKKPKKKSGKTVKENSRVLIGVGVEK